MGREGEGAGTGRPRGTAGLPGRMPTHGPGGHGGTRRAAAVVPRDASTRASVVYARTAEAVDARRDTGPVARPTGRRFHLFPAAAAAAAAAAASVTRGRGNGRPSVLPSVGRVVVMSANGNRCRAHVATAWPVSRQYSRLA